MNLFKLIANFLVENVRCFFIVKVFYEKFSESNGGGNSPLNKSNFI